MDEADSIVAEMDEADSIVRPKSMGSRQVMIVCLYSINNAVLNIQLDEAFI